MKITSKRFGAIEVREDRILHMKGGLLGFGNLERFAILEDQEDPNLPFRWLVSMDDPEIGFLVTDPGIFFKDYVFDLTEADRNELQIKNAEDVTVLTLLTVPRDPKQITANLAGPLVINAQSLQGKQVILQDGYTTKHYIFVQNKTEEETAGASTNATPNFAIAPDTAAAEIAKAANHTEVKTTA